MADLRAGILLIRPSKAFRYSGCPPVHVHAAFSRVIGDDHSSSRRRSFGLGPLTRSDGRPVEEGDLCRPDELFGFRAAFAGSAWSNALDEHIGAGRELELNERRWQTEDWLPEQDADGRSYEELCEGTRPDTHLSLELTSATVWSADDSGGLLAPTPARVFRGLVEVWEYLAADGDDEPTDKTLPPLKSAISATITKQVKRTVRMTRLVLDTVVQPLRKARTRAGLVDVTRAGVVGLVEMEFTALREEPELLRDLCWLLELSRYVGVGAKTSFGFGQARPGGR